MVDGEEKVYNTSVLLDPQGEQIARYRKIHLFDIEVAGQVQANESAIMAPGDEVVVARTDLASVGISICYDLRFPELYRSLTLNGAQIILSPAAFTLYTGKDHWELLVRARAVENAVYMVAPAQFGKHPPAEHSFGNTMIVDPWGAVIARASDRETAVVADVDLDWQSTVRRSLPSLGARRPDVYTL
ncbi:MAG: nitrilase-related carbon-nitrogen hydrolase [Nocardioidaceae bacterium]